ncbi:MAG: hypothetical protein Q8N39_10925, partial [Pelolinea sp.]|nr:hypothetical protein [Pelolinea sp.]
RDWYPGFSFIDYLDDLAFTVPALFHDRLLFYLLCLFIIGTILGEPYRGITGSAPALHPQEERRLKKNQLLKTECKK